jgi:hypothetical protein
MSKPSSPGRLPVVLRPLLLLTLAVLTVWIALAYPVARQTEWPPPQRFEPQDDVCRQARAEREWSSFTVPDEVGFTSPDDVGENFSVDVSWLCRANGFDDDCGRDRLGAGALLLLPLHREAVAAARAARRGGESEAGKEPGGR